MSQTTERFEREVQVEEGTYRAGILWRGAETGYGVLYFRPVDPSSGDRNDRRALVGPDVEPASLDEPELLALYAGGRPLTETERRFAAPDGRQWLAQNRGPVWAGRAGADGGTGILFSSLEGKPQSLRTAGGHIEEMSEEELAAAWRSAGGSGDPIVKPSSQRASDPP